ncbi:zinc ribbon domain-containing protein [Zoogloea sp.]|uniref:zinc ribbon domain-containing protein n=1 Tax=Zoogloea sp. TaxID=49181 RepID=UPI00261BA38E|nr:zinc ribbon domain-containing protein [Zoogloea sp.]MDD3352595.1 zinc ribbon domain-containing protein [Zoogloea sp.]
MQDQGWRAFRRQLEYMPAWKGAQLIAAPAHYTSQTCPCCDHGPADNPSVCAWARITIQYSQCPQGMI